MNQITTFSFTDKNSYKEFSKEVKAQSVNIIESLRGAKLKFKELQRDHAEINEVYSKIQYLREHFKDSENLRARAKVEASRQYEASRQKESVSI